jgi:signal transduction histidine kinase
MSEEKTYFASAIRSTLEELNKESELIGSQKFFHEIFGTFSGTAAVIDKNRQIVYANDELLAFLGFSSMEFVLGKRPGEAVSCTNSSTEPEGCGTSEACRYCGTVNAIIESQKTGIKSLRETHITSNAEGKQRSLDLTVTSTPISIAGQTFYVLILKDISDEKRRLALERIFFHDILNSAGGLNGLLALLKEETDPDEVRKIINLSEEASREILEEILLQRQILAAENGDLEVKIEKVSSLDLLNSSLSKISSHEVGQNKKVIVDEHSVDLEIYTDKLLLQRVLINLIKNALEATREEGIVEVGIESKDEKLCFWVKNDMVISPEVKLQLFQRSFSTKGSNRGIGTYSIKLLTESYLKGKVSFVSNENEGTIFSVLLNKP